MDRESLLKEINRIGWEAYSDGETVAGFILAHLYRALEMNIEGAMFAQSMLFAEEYLLHTGSSSPSEMRLEVLEK